MWIPNNFLLSASATILTKPIFSLMASAFPFGAKGLFCTSIAGKFFSAAACERPAEATSIALKVQRGMLL